jgi:hypothetical protein
VAAVVDRVVETIRVKEAVVPVPLRVSVVVAGPRVGRVAPFGPVMVDVTVMGPVKVFILVRVMVNEPELGRAIV